jgi:hypothetical protein
MNERIKELLKQATKEVDPYDRVWVFSKVNHEKFAELIVKECGVALRPMLRDMISRGQAFDLIKKHFGVEE